MGAAPNRFRLLIAGALMLKPHLAAGIAAGLILLHSGVATAQDYPTKPVRIVTGEAGGSNDFAARLIASGITGPLGQTVIVDNRTGGVIAVEIVSKAVPDGHTLL